MATRKLAIIYRDGRQTTAIHDVLFTVAPIADRSMHARAASGFAGARLSVSARD